MVFNQLMALAMPPIVACFFYFKLKKREPFLLEVFGFTVLVMLITNIIGYSFLLYIQGTMSLLFTMSFTVKYSCFALLIAAAVTAIYRFLELNITLNMKVESTHEKND